MDEEVERWRVEEEAAAQDEDSSGLNRLGLAYEAAARLGDAERAFRSAAALGDGEASYHLGRMLTIRGRRDEAIVAYREAAGRGETRARLNLGDALMDDYGQEAEAELQYVIARDAGDTDAYCHLGVLLDAQDRPEEAEAQFRAGAEAGNDVARWMLAGTLAESGRVEEAADEYRIAAAQGSREAAIDLAVLLVDLGDLDEAERYYEEALDDREAAPADAHNAYGSFLSSQGRFEEAESLYANALSQGLDEVLLNYANLLADDLVRLAEAESVYRRAIASGDVRGHNNLAVLLRGLGRESEAKAEYSTGMEAGDGLAARNLGIQLLSTEHWSEALAPLRRAVELGTPGAHKDLGDLFAREGERDEAERHYLAAVELDVPDARFNYGIMLKEHNRAEAMVQFELAGAEGDDAARVELECLRAELSGTGQSVEVSSLTTEAHLSFYAEWLPDIDISSVLAGMHEVIAQFPYVVLSCLDSARSVASLPSIQSFAASRGLSRDVLGEDLLLDGPRFQLLATDENFLTGFDEVWFCQQRPYVESPRGFVLTSDRPIQGSPPQAVRAWMTDADCELALGDGDGLNYITSSLGLARLLKAAVAAG